MKRFQPESLIADYFKSRPEVVAVYLFGSYAVQKERPYSDLDIAILIDYAKSKKFAELHSTYQCRLARLTRRDIDLVIMNTAGEGLLKQIYKQGKCLLINDAEKHTVFKMGSFCRIADFGYHQAKMQRSYVQFLTRGSSRG